MPVAKRLPVREKIVCAVLLLSVTLGSLMNLGGVTTLQRAFALGILTVGAILALPGGSLRTTLGRAAAVCAFVACTVVSYLRFAAAPVTPIGSRTMIGLALMLMIVTALAMCALLAPADELTRRRRLRCAIFSPVCFVAFDLGLYIIGFSFPVVQTETKNNGASQMLGFFGVHATRANLPLNPGLNGAGAMGALALVITIMLTYHGRGRLRQISIAGVLASLATILLVDSRGPLIFAVISLVLVAILPRAARRGMVVLPLILPIAPAIILFALGKLGGLAPSLSRSQGDFITATGRQAVWATVTRFLSHPHVQDLVGYGAYGQVKSGVGSQYAYIFPYSLYPWLSNTHNIALQIILDMGYLGFVVFLIFLMVAVNSARRTDQSNMTPESAALLTGLVALSLFGADEAIPSIEGIYLLVSVLVLACAAIRVPVVTRFAPSSLYRAKPSYVIGKAPRMATQLPTLTH
jgi:O-antigen ligase